MWLGVMTFAVLFPLSLLVRTRPEHMHTYPDGEPLGTPPSARAVRAGRTGYEQSLTVREALRTPTFWFITLALGLGMFGFAGWQAHWVPYFRDNGLTNAQAARVILVYGVFTMTARFVWGFVSERYRIRYVFAANAALIGVGVMGLLVFRSLPWVYLWAVPLGLSMGGFFQLQALIMTDYFGREHIGAVRGMGRPIITPFSTASPLALALLRDWGGSYLWAFTMVALAWFCCSMLVLRAKPVQQAASPGRESFDSVRSPD
jgi:cyanate permease